MNKLLRSATSLAGGILRRPRLSAYDAIAAAFRTRGTHFARSLAIPTHPPAVIESNRPNPLAAYFEAHQSGRGLFKWQHYFEIYDRYLSRFTEREVNLLEIGIYSGGSLEMWRQYLGEKARIYGVDIEDACRVYEGDRTRILIGDQGRRAFWRGAKKELPLLDAVIDDGGHLPEQQIVTFEELLPLMRPGGVYICEDVHGRGNLFAAYMHGFATSLHAAKLLPTGKKELSVPSNALQILIKAIHEYPFVFVIEINDSPRSDLQALRRGSEWQPFM